MNEPNFVLVTGASEGIGKAIALSCLHHGFEVGLVSRNQEKLDFALAEAGEKKRNALSLTADLTDPTQVDRLINQVIHRKGRIDILVNNLGRGLQREIIETTNDDWEYLFKINLSSAFYMCRATLPHMRKRKTGNIVNIASRAGRKGEGDFSAYCAFKHALVGLTRALADSESKHGIRVNAICPGLVSTKRLKKTKPNLDFSKASQPVDVANAVLFLLSPAAQTMNGQVIDMYRN
jgi:3-oxoacyl-[acyl-carrier protein] reductase